VLRQTPKYYYTGSYQSYRASTGSQPCDRECPSYGDQAHVWRQRLPSCDRIDSCGSSVQIQMEESSLSQGIIAPPYRKAWESKPSTTAQPLVPRRFRAQAAAFRYEEGSGIDLFHFTRYDSPL
jgi:hypothetical protein